MCFSATASFTASAFLLSTGLYSCRLASQKDSKYVPLALVPFAFGIQQGVEGLQWLALNGTQADFSRVVALAYLAFSHGFWLVWLPLSMLVLETRAWATKLLLFVTLLGALFGLSLYGPFLLDPDTFSVTVTQGSIDYQTELIYDRFLSRDILRLIYMAIVVGPTILSQATYLRILGGLGAISLVIAYWFYNYAFVSVWCFFAAVISALIAYGLHAALKQPLVEAQS